MKNKEFILWFNEWNKNPYIPWADVPNSTHKDWLHPLYKKGMPVHPLTCGNDSTHENLIAIEENDIIKLKCKNCDYIQDFVPSQVHSLYKNHNN